MLEVILQRIYNDASEKGFQNRGICAFFFLYYVEKKIKLQEYNDLTKLFWKEKPSEKRHREFFNHSQYRKGESDFWWFRTPTGDQQRLLFIKHLIQLKNEENSN